MNSVKFSLYIVGAFFLLALASPAMAGGISVVRDTALISENPDADDFETTKIIEGQAPDPSSVGRGVAAATATAAATGIYISADEQVQGRAPVRKRKQPVRGDTVINFVNADIREVSKAILGEMLGLNYAVAQNVQGTITIKINKPLAKEEVLPALGAAFRMNGVAIVERGGITKVVPAADANRESSATTMLRSKTSDYGLQIVSLRYIGGEEMRKLLDPIAPAGGVVPVEFARNVLILAGSEADRTAMADMVDMFDVDWLAGMNFGMFQLKEATAKPMVSEIWEVLGGQNGPLGKVVQLVPLERLNAIVVITRQQRYIGEVKSWIDRFDVNQNPNEQRIWVYPVQNGRAATLSETLGKLTENKDTASEAMPDSAPQTGLQLAKRKKFSPGMKIISDDTTNSLIFMGTKADFVAMEDALKKLDIVPLQVRIEAVVAEVTLTDDLRYGIQYLFQKGEFKSILTKADSLVVNPTLPGFSTFVSGKNITSILDLLQSVTKVHVVSSPQVTILNNQTATLQIGDQVPVATQSSTSTSTLNAPVINTIQMVDTGVILKVTPRVNSSGMVTMDISQEVSDVTRTTTSNLDSPTIKQRKIASSIAVRDGETIALGGLITDASSNARDGIPLLSEIPVVGALFANSDDSTARTELLALITPRVIRSDKDVREITEDMRKQIGAVAPLQSKIH